MKFNTKLEKRLQDIEEDVALEKEKTEEVKQELVKVNQKAKDAEERHNAKTDEVKECVNDMNEQLHSIQGRFVMMYDISISCFLLELLPQ